MSNDGVTAPGRGRAFVATSQVLGRDDVERALTRMAHEMVERHQHVEDLTLIGLQAGGEPFATRLGALLASVSGIAPFVGLLDVSFYRDDLTLRPIPRTHDTLLDHDLSGRHVILVDDVLYTGRTIRAALVALSDWGRPTSVQLAVMVDRGHRELPIRPDYVGKNLPTSLDEAVVATLEGVWIGTRTTDA